MAGVGSQRVTFPCFYLVLVSVIFELLESRHVYYAGNIQGVFNFFLSNVIMGLARFPLFKACLLCILSIVRCVSGCLHL